MCTVVRPRQSGSGECVTTSTIFMSLHAVDVDVWPWTAAIALTEELPGPRADF